MEFSLISRRIRDASTDLSPLRRERESNTRHTDGITEDAALPGREPAPEQTNTYISPGLSVGSSLESLENPVM